MGGFSRNAFHQMLCGSAAIACIAVAAPACAQTRTFDVPAQDASKGIPAFARQAGIQLLASAKDVRGKRTGAVRGSHTVAEGLALLLQGTGLEAVGDTGGSGIITIRRREIAAASRATGGAQVSPRPGGAGVKVGNAPAAAETAASSSAMAENASAEIVVTGTHIRGAPASSPVITISRKEIDRSGYANVGSLIRSLPQNFNGGNNPQVVGAPGSENVSTSGGSAPNLRGLGSTSTLTLIDGHRLGQDTFTGAVDISLIPLSVVDRVDVLTDGASATYGSDAVAGVVNFILKKDFDGALSSAFIGKATQGGGLERDLSQLVGKTWANGGALISYEFDKSDAIYTDQRAFSSSAYTPTTLLPDSRRSSFYGSAHQNVTSAVSAWVEGLYTFRHSSTVQSLAADSPTYADSPVRQYSLAGGLDLAISHSWNVSLFGSTSQQTSTQNAFMPATEDNSGFTSKVRFHGKSNTVELIASGSLFRLPGGVSRIALGGGYRQDGFSQRTMGGGSSDIDATRGVHYLFSELNLPLTQSEWPGLQRLDFNVAGRYENYQRVGSKFVVRYGIMYVPIKGLTARASYGNSFRAPGLYQEFAGGPVALLAVPDPESPSGESNVLIPQGRPDHLKPETSKNWTLSLDFEPEAIKGLKTTLTYYNIKYRNRIGQISNVFAGLTDPINAPFVTRSPSAIDQSRLIADSGQPLQNYTDGVYDPANVAAIVDFRYLNVARQDIDGLDLLVDYQRSTQIGQAEFFANATYLDLRQAITSTAPQVTLSGDTFQPTKFRARLGGSLSGGGWSGSAILNYLGKSTNTFQPTATRVASWTTVDGQLTYALPNKHGILSGLELVLSVQNLFDQDPPRVVFNDFVPGIGYDSTNASPVGRFVSLRVNKKW